jgi:hypothetical protein
MCSKAILRQPLSIGSVLLHEREIEVLVPGRPQLLVHGAGMLGLNMPKAATRAPDRRAK